MRQRHLRVQSRLQRRVVQAAVRARLLRARPVHCARAVLLLRRLEGRSVCGAPLPSGLFFQEADWHGSNVVGQRDASFAGREGFDGFSQVL